MTKMKSEKMKEMEKRIMELQQVTMKYNYQSENSIIKGFSAQSVKINA